MDLDFNFFQILNYHFGGNSLKEYLLAFLAFVFTLLVLKISKELGIKKIKRLANSIHKESSDLLMKIIESLGWPFYLILALGISFQFVVLPEKIERYFSYLVFIILIFYVIKSIQKLINFGAEKIIEKRKKEEKKVDTEAINFLNNILKFSLWFIAILLILQNLGIEITSLIAGLGIGGIAIAFALQAILSDIFACFAIYFDKPVERAEILLLSAIN